MLVLAPLCGAEQPTEEDRDGDGIPDDYDPFPDDRERPGRVEPHLLYAHTSGELFAFERQSGKRPADTPRALAPFTFSDGRARDVTDIAIDRWGVLWAVGFSERFTCHPQTARCEVMGGLKGSFNGLAALRGAEPSDDLLVAAGTDGAVVSIARDGNVRALGNMGSGSSGDLVQLGDRVFVARNGRANDELVAYSASAIAGGQLGPGEVVATLASTTTYGVAACDDGLYTFDDRGTMSFGSPHNLSRIADTRVGFWGAACSRPRSAPVAGSDSAPSVASKSDPGETREAKPGESEPSPAGGCLAASD